MDEEKRKKIVQQFKDFVKEIGDGDPDFKALLDLAIDDPARILDENDVFPFDGTKCITDCDGRCCFLIDMVRVSPVDVDYMLKSEITKGVSRRDFVKRHLQVFLGGESRIPMAIIKMKKVGAMQICPFIRVVKKLGVDSTSQIVVNSGIGGVCALGQKFKPTICMLYPLARASFIYKDNKESIFIRYNCKATETDKMMKVSDYISDYRNKSDINNRYVSDMNRIISRLKETFPEKLVNYILQTFASYIYFEDGAIQDKMKKIGKDVDEIIARVLEEVKEKNKYEQCKI